MPPKPDDGAVATDTKSLLDAVYSVATDPARLSDLFAQLQLQDLENHCPESASLALAMLNHIRRALRLGAAHSAMQRERMQLREVINSISPPVLVIDRNAILHGMNKAAQIELERHSWFSVHGNKLICKEPLFLDEMVSEADAHTSASRKIPGRKLTHSANSGQIMYAYRSSESNQHYSLIILDKSLSISNSIKYLASRTGLTEQEVKVVDLLIHESSMKVVSEILFITLSTLRQHIKNILQKTGTHHQGALIALILQNLVLEQCTAQHDPNLLALMLGMSHTNRVTLPDGRQLSYSEMGAKEGIPVLHFHSLNASRLELMQYAKIIEAAGIRLITPDRAGYGYSTMVKRDSYLQYTSDIEFLLDHLHLDSVYGLSASGGCSHALVSASQLNKRFYSVHCMAAVPPKPFIMDSFSPSVIKGSVNQFFTSVPGLFRLCMELVFMGQSVESVLTTMVRSKHKNIFHLSAEDIDFINQEDLLPYHVAMMVESQRQGTHAFVMESTMVNKPWPVSLDSVRVPVHFWHGTDDKLIAPDMTCSFAEALPDATFSIVKNETHLLTYRHLPVVLARISQSHSELSLIKTAAQEPHIGKS